MPLQKISNWTSHLRNRHFMMIDLIICLMSPLLALFVRLDGKIDFETYGQALLYVTIIFAQLKLVVFHFFGLYKRFWQTASIDELARLIYVGINAFMIEAFVFILLRSIDQLPVHLLPASFPFLDLVITMFFVGSVRFSIRVIERAKELGYSYNRNSKYAIIIGAGSAGSSVAQELQRKSEVGIIPVAFLDDDPEKLKMKIRGIPVIGKTTELEKVVTKYRIPKVIIAMPTASGKKIRKIVNDAHKLGVEALTVPGIFEILSGKVGIEKIRPIEIEDLLRRAPIKTDKEKVNKFLNSKKILITGAGGSIGSELCRQILEANPSEILLVGHGENSIFNIVNELRLLAKNQNTNQQSTKISCSIADIRFKNRLRTIFRSFLPDVVFHAAAHKHVPLMELNPTEAVTNNIGGTKNLVDLSVEFKVRNFVMISTDKAVNPTNVMGATKRAAEMIVLDAARKTKYNYVVTRFGNVLGSRGSVVQTFRKQLMSGGPLTLTHPEIKRYFMTIPEAVQLVLQASVLGDGGEIFVFDMGEPVKIIDLAKDMIKLAGMEEGIDIDIKITGLREGEKMYEELFIEGEVYDNTVHPKIMIARNASRIISSDLENSVQLLINVANSNDEVKLLQLLKMIVPEFNPNNSRFNSNLALHKIPSSSQEK